MCGGCYGAGSIAWWRRQAVSVGKVLQAACAITAYHCQQARCEQFCRLTSQVCLSAVCVCLRCIGWLFVQSSVSLSRARPFRAMYGKLHCSKVKVAVLVICLRGEPVAENRNKLGGSQKYNTIVYVHPVPGAPGDMACQHCVVLCYM